MAEKLSAITGLRLDQAEALLNAYGGEINAAAEAHFGNNGANVRVRPPPVL